MELTDLTANDKDLNILERINEEAIPECERNSLADLLATGAEITGIYEDAEPVGFMVIRRSGELIYLAYLAVRHDLRSTGTGSKALRELIAKNAGCRIVVEYEAPDSSSENSDMRTRRRNFYARNGFRSTGFFTFYDDTEFEIACAGEEFDAEEFCRFTEHLSAIVEDHIPKPYRRDGK